MTHGTFFAVAQEEGLISDTSIHAGIRCKLEVSLLLFSTLTPIILNLKSQGEEDLENDESVGFQLISGDDIDDLGIPEIIRLIRKRIGDSPVYLRSVILLSFDALLNVRPYHR